MTPKPTLNSQPSCILLATLPAPSFLQVIHLVLRGLPSFVSVGHHNLSPFLFLLVGYLLLFPSCYTVSLCEPVDLSVGGIPGVGPMVSLDEENGIEESP